MQIFYINLAHRPDRRAFMEVQFARLGLAATRIEAVTPADLSADDIARSCDPKRRLWLTQGELSCSMSHFRALEEFLATNAAWATILEDDAVLAPRLPSFLAAFEAAPPALDLVRIETGLLRLTLPRGAGDVAGIALRPYVGWDLGAAGYLVSRQAAASILAAGEGRRLPIDLALFHWSSRLRRRLEVRQADPALCIQSEHLPGAEPFVSSIVDRDGRGLAEARYPVRHFIVGLWRGLYRDVVVGSAKTWHRFVLGAERRRVEFAAE